MRRVRRQNCHVNCGRLTKIEAKNNNQPLTNNDACKREMQQHVITDSVDPKWLAEIVALYKGRVNVTIMDDHWTTISAQPAKRPNRQYFTYNEVHGCDKQCCVVCGNDHDVVNCQSFLDLKRHERTRTIMLAKLCRLCLKKGHSYGECPAQPCIKCDERHHILLCRQ